MSFHPLTFGLFVSYPSVLYLLCFSLSVPPLLPYFLGRRQEHRRLGGSQGHRLDSLLCHHVAVRPQHMLPAIWASCLSSPQDLPENPPPPPGHCSCCFTGLIKHLSYNRTLLTQLQLPLSQGSVHRPSLPCPPGAPAPYTLPLQCWIGPRFSDGFLRGAAVRWGLIPSHPAAELQPVFYGLDPNQP